MEVVAESVNPRSGVHLGLYVLGRAWSTPFPKDVRPAGPSDVDATPLKHTHGHAIAPCCRSCSIRDRKRGRPCAAPDLEQQPRHGTSPAFREVSAHPLLRSVPPLFLLDLGS
jgi:hypothetical protein